MSADHDAQRRRGVRVLGIVFVVILVVLLGVALVMSRMVGTPAYWTEQQERIAALSEDEKKVISHNLRNRLATEWSDAGPEVPTTAADLYGHRRTIEIPYDDFNVWLAAEGIDLLAEVGVRLPSAVQAAMVDSAGGGLLRITCDLQSGDIQQVVALVFEIDVGEDGTVTSRLAGATAGRLPMPTEVAIDQIARRSNSERMVHLMQGTPTGPIELPIDRGRDGRLVGLEVREDALVVERETVRPKQANE